MSTANTPPPPTTIGTYETGVWFLDQDRQTIHRTLPEKGYIFRLNTIDTYDTPHGGNGVHHSALIIDSAEEVEGKTFCPVCFPPEVSA